MNIVNRFVDVVQSMRPDPHNSSSVSSNACTPHAHPRDPQVNVCPQRRCIKRPRISLDRLSPARRHRRTDPSMREESGPVI